MCDSRIRCKVKTVFLKLFLPVETLLTNWSEVISLASPPPPTLALLLFFIFILLYLFIFFWKGRDDPAEFWSMPIAAFSKSQSQQ